MGSEVKLGDVTKDVLIGFETHMIYIVLYSALSPS